MGSEVPETLTRDECQERCLDNSDCQGILTIHRHRNSGEPTEGPCWLRKDLDVQDCEKGTPWDLWVIGDRGDFPASSSANVRVQSYAAAPSVPIWLLLVILFAIILIAILLWLISSLISTKKREVVTVAKSGNSYVKITKDEPKKVVTTSVTKDDPKDEPKVVKDEPKVTITPKDEPKTVTESKPKLKVHQRPNPDIVVVTHPCPKCGYQHTHEWNTCTNCAWTKNLVVDSLAPAHYHNSLMDSSGLLGGRQTYLAAAPRARPLLV